MMLTQTCPFSVQGDGPAIVPWNCIPNPQPWKSTWTPASMSAWNEKGEKTKIASNPRNPVR